MRVEPAAGKPAIETKIVTLFLLGKKKGHPGNIFTKLKLLNVDDFLFMKIKFETIYFESTEALIPLCTVLFAINKW